MNELDEIYELEASEENTPTTAIQTQYGPVPIPVDENWHEYTKDEREFIKDIVCRGVELEEADTKEYFIDNEMCSAHKTTMMFSLEEVKKASDGAVILEGDYGGQIYLTCPAKHVKCSEEVLKKLLCEIDKIEWDCNEGGGVNIDYCRAKSGDDVFGGMCGGVVEDGLWIHPDICPKKAESIRMVINGEFNSIN